MLFALVICHIVVASVANPFYKYPFVFLLNVGNEELAKTNTDQIRVSIPGGSLALRYPAVGDGEIITNVRVSGIDFGTELKANIIDGGPGYKYVFLVFSGNKGIPYDAVITLQTVASNMEPGNNDLISDTNRITDKPDSYQTNDESDLNNSAEEIDDSVENTINNDNNAELAQPSSKVFNYAQEEDNNDEERDDDSDVEDENDDISDEKKDIHADYNENVDNYKDKRADDRDSLENSLSKGNVEDNKENQYRAEKLQANYNEYVYSNNNKFLESDTLGQGISLDEDPKMYRQDALYDAQGHDNVYSAGDLDEFDQMFNDEEVHNDANKYKDSNNNNFDSDYDSAVTY